MGVNISLLRLGVEDPVSFTDCPLSLPVGFYMGRSRKSSVLIPRALGYPTCTSLTNSDPGRWLISKDRSEEAWAILVRYHAEGDPNNEYVKAEYAEMVTAIQMDLESRKQTWSELISTTANLKRCALVAFIGVFSQWSGNGLVSYYLARVLETVGITEKATQNKVNLGLNCWNLVTGMAASLLVGITPRRVMYLTSVAGMLVIFAAWTGASARYAETGEKAAAVAVVAMIFLYCKTFILLPQ